MNSSAPACTSEDATLLRRFHRFPTNAAVRLYSGSEMWNTRVLDLSLRGVSLHAPDGWAGALGSRYRLDLRLGGGVLIAMGVELVRIEDDSLGFMRLNIDLASFEKLKRLVELNLGNHKSLLDELAGLGH